MYWNEVVEQRLNGLNELDDFRFEACESSLFYKENMKKYHDQKIEKLDFVVAEHLQVALVSVQTQVQVDWSILVTQVFPHGAVELENKEGVRFKVNGKRIIIYLGHVEKENEVIEAYHFDEV